METRQANRKVLTLPGRYYTGKGTPVEVDLNDISTGGCRFARGDAELEVGTPIQIYIGDAGPFHARVCWTDESRAGIAFATPLDKGQFAHFRNCHVARRAEESEIFTPDTIAEAKPRRYC